MVDMEDEDAEELLQRMELVGGWRTECLCARNLPLHAPLLLNRVCPLCALFAFACSTPIQPCLHSVCPLCLCILYY